MQTLLKVAKKESLYKKISPSTMLKRDIPVIRSLPRSPAQAKKKLDDAISKSKDTWSHPQVAVKDLDLKALGFKPTRLAIPIPGERIGTVSWRAGPFHAHKMGDVFLVHKDESAPDSVRGFLRHTVKDTTKTLKKMRGAVPPVIMPGQNQR